MEKYEEDYDEDHWYEQDIEEEVKTRKVESYKILSMDDVEKKLTERVELIKDLFQTTEDDAITLLKFYKWDNHKLQQDYFENDIKIKISAGLLLPPGIIFEHHIDSACLICLNKLLSKPNDCLLCGHKFCSDCWNNYIKFTVEKGKDCLMAKCPLAGCPIIIPKSIYAKYLSPKLLLEYKKYLCKSFTDDNKYVRWCPAIGCKYLAYNEQLTLIEIKCTCGNKFCFGCGEPSHNPCTCKMLTEWKIKNSSESENITWIVANTKQCPQCQKPIEKVHGCNHMICGGCKYEFCWVCFGPWKKHNYQTGGYYKCNKYEEAIKGNKGLVNQKLNQAKAKTILAKYSFYFERYNNHDKAMKLGIKQLAELETKILNLHTVKKIALPELDFLRNASECLIEVRNVLKNSYIYGFYLSDAKEKDLFEFMQGQLEENCDHLHQLLERNISDYLEQEQNEPFYAYRAELMNYFEATKKV